MIDYRRKVGFLKNILFLEISILITLTSENIFPNADFEMFDQKIRKPLYNKCFCDHQLSNAPRFGQICEILRDMEFI